jgi:hypothetical protein
MKPKKVKRIRLGKETIRNLDKVLDREEQKRVKGGTDVNPPGLTQVPIYC